MDFILGHERVVMDIAFRTKRLMRTFNSEKALKKKYGDRMARAIRSRLAVLKNARTLSLVPATTPDRLHALIAERKGQYAVDLIHPYRLTFVPAHDSASLREDGSLDRAKVTAITIIEVVDYH